MFDGCEGGIAGCYATFERNAKGLETPDHVAITVFNYRWRLGLVQGETQYEPLEQKLAQAPSKVTPTALRGRRLRHALCRQVGVQPDY